MKTTATRYAHDLTAAELDNSPLADLAREAGYASLKSLLNEHSLWNQTIAQVEAQLRAQLATPAE